MIDIYLARLWPEMIYEGIPKYWRRRSNGYNVRRVLDPTGEKTLSKRWALYRNEQRVWDAQAMPNQWAAIEAAEEYRKENKLV